MTRCWRLVLGAGGTALRLRLTAPVALLILLLAAAPALAAPEEPPSITEPPPQTSTAGVAIATLVVSGERMATLTAEGLPAGLTLEEVSETEGRIVGTPTHAQTTVVTLHAKNEENVEVSKTFEWTVEAEALPTIEKPGDQASTVGVAIEPVKVTGTLLASLKAKELPAGLELKKVSEAEWLIEGTPATAKAMTVVTLEAQNAEEGPIVTQTFSWTVEPVPPPPPPPPPTATGQLAVSPGVVFSAARAGCGGLVWSPATVSTQWLLDGLPIVGASASTFVPPRVDDGHVLSCRQTAVSANGSTVLTAPSRVVHEQPPQPAWPIGPASQHCSTPVCMQSGSGAGPVGQSYLQEGAWSAAQQVRCVSAPWTSAAGESSQPTVRAFAEAQTVRMTLQRMTPSGPQTIAAMQLSGLAGARDELDGAGSSPFPGTILAGYGTQALAAGELWSRRFPASLGAPAWYAPGGGLLLYGLTVSSAAPRSFQLLYTLTAADLGTRLRCVAAAEDGPAGAPTAAVFAGPEYTVRASTPCAPRRIVSSASIQPAVLQVGDAACISGAGVGGLGPVSAEVASRGGKLALAVACAQHAGCRGPLSLLSLPHGHAAAKVLAKASVAAARGSSRLLHLTLDAAGRQALRAAGGGGLRARVRFLPRGGTPISVAVILRSL
jgi:hypothetical protein